MERKTLEEANALANQIEKLENEIEQLQRPRITITVSGVNGSGSYTFSTIGTDANCEHPDALAARLLLNSLVMRRSREAQAAKEKLDKL